MDGTPHNCLEGGPDHVAGQVASPPASAPPTTEQKHLQGEGGNLGKDLEDKLYGNAEVITLEIWTRSQTMARTLSTSSATPEQVNSLAEILANIMAQVIAK